MATKAKPPGYSVLPATRCATVLPKWASKPDVSLFVPLEILIEVIETTHPPIMPSSAGPLYTRLESTRTCYENSLTHGILISSWCRPWNSGTNNSGTYLGRHSNWRRQGSGKKYHSKSPRD